MSAAGPRRAGRNGERGFALLIVLWAVALLALIGTRLTAGGRTEAQLASNLRAAAVAEAAADGAVHEAAFHLLDAPDRRWPADDQPRALRVGAVPVVVRVRDEAGRINPNTAPPELLDALLRAVGADSRAAARLAAAIADWRFPGVQKHPNGAKAPEYRAAGLDYGPPGAPFRSIDELGAVLGMTPELLARLRPHLTVAAEGEPDPARADPVVLAALRALGGGQLPDGDEDPGAARAVTVTATAAPAGARFTRRATLRLDQGQWRILTWDTGVD